MSLGLPTDLPPSRCVHHRFSSCARVDDVHPPPLSSQFASLWGQLAAKYADEPRVIFGLMNEPRACSRLRLLDFAVADRHPYFPSDDLNDFGPFVGSLQEAVNAIREAGANTQHILLPGNDWTHVKTMVESSGPALVSGVKDPAGGQDKLVIDV